MRALNNIVVTAIRANGLALLVALALPLASQAEEHAMRSNSEKPFSSMAIAPDDPVECGIPRPSADLAATAYLRNGYRAILRILVAEEWRETRNCDCLLDQFTWDMALENKERFRTSDNPLLPFKVLDLYAMADALEAERETDCSE